MSLNPNRSRIYDGDGDILMEDQKLHERLVILPNTKSEPNAMKNQKIRLLWGQNLLDDLLSGRYHSLVCAVNTEDNSHGIIAQLAHLLPTSQWDAQSITEYASWFAHRESLSVIKFDMDAVEVLGLLRPKNHEHLTLSDLRYGFRFVSEMIKQKPIRRPVASVSFLGAKANKLIDIDNPNSEPSFETVLRIMHESGFSGDVYPSPWMWQSAPTAVYPTYPFPDSLDDMRMGGS
ncbi:hypothetical protein KS4_11930 [Poriferisphaera corsica]|uniref:Uncharacterized protein n=1 Tax=Poriferisphaera corsica TaxID=2528020 RepID=A0A517YSF5_9BACT|nr:hypothetical protein [Poriferisphaera corsica]QDU33148.1 hypothetical protein KS4_11930 [Poriferisphaera corsica]